VSSPPNILFTSVAYYLQVVEAFSADVSVVDLELVALPWYSEQLEKWDTRLFRNSRNELEALALEYRRHIHGEGTVAGVKARHTGLIHSLISGNWGTDPLCDSGNQSGIFNRP